jgi:hypothetical protein
MSAFATTPAKDAEAFLHATLARQSESMARHEFAGREVWVKKAGPRNPRWRYRLQGLIATVLRLETLRPVMNLGGPAAIAHEARRLNELAALGLRVPELLAQETHGLMIADLGTRDQPARNLLVHLAQAARESPVALLAVWRRGLDAIATVHARGSYLSQAFARNLVVCADGEIAFIDFEDDPGATLTLAACQARDWLSYLHSSALYLDALDGFEAARAPWHALLAAAQPGTREALRLSTTRMAWLRHLPASPRWGTDTARLRAAARFLAAMRAPEARAHAR